MRRITLISALCLAGSLATSSCGSDRALTQQQFTELVVAEAEESLQGILISRVDERGFSYAKSNGSQGRIVTDEEYAHYVRHPDDLDRLVERVVSLLTEDERVEQVLDDATRLRRSIMPQLKPRSFLGEADARSGGQPLLYGEHTTGLLVFFVIDQPTSVSYLTAGSLSGLGMTREQLSRLALENLSRRTGEDRFVIERTSDGPIAVGQSLDGYDASRLISPTLYATAAEMLGVSRVVVAVPRRDLMLLAPADSPPLRERLQARARSEHHAGPFPLTPALFEVDRHGVRPLDAE